METSKSKLKPIAILLAIVILVVVVHYFGIDARIKDVRLLQDWLKGFGFVAYIIFLCIYVGAAVLILPAAPLTIAAGITFGSFLGGALSLAGATLGAAAAFLVAKYAARDFILRKFGENPLFKKIEDGFTRNGISFLILTRLVPVFPYNLQNYAYGLSSMNFLPYVGVSFITMAPGAFIYAFMAGEIIKNGFSFKLLLEFAAAGVVLFVISLVPKYIAGKKQVTY